jgi:hypothetical protein
MFRVGDRTAIEQIGPVILFSAPLTRLQQRKRVFLPTEVAAQRKQERPRVGSHARDSRLTEGATALSDHRSHAPCRLSTA